MQSSVTRTRSISMIAQMAAGAAHELNNPLAVISGRAQMVRSQTEDPEIARATETIVEHAQRATDIVTELVRFAKPEPPSPTSFRLASLLEPLFQHWMAGSVLSADQLRVSLADEAVTVYADRKQVTELLGALLANAEAACEQTDAFVKVNSPSRTSDETVRILIEDNGIGMSRDVLEHAVDPFFSSRPAGRGRGLGLSQAARLAEINGGRLWLESILGTGTTVTVELPTRAPGA